MFAEDLFDRRRLGAVVELGRAGMSVDVIDMLGGQLSIDQRIAPDQEMIEFICNENQQFRRRIKVDEGNGIGK